MTQPPESAFWLALIYASGLRLARVKDIVTAWCLEGKRPLSALFELPSGKIAAQFGLSAEETGQVAAAAEYVSEQVGWLTRLERDGVQLVTRADSRYPQALIRWFPRVMQPLLLFCQGDLRMLSRPSAAVIGARDSRPETVGLARELATLLAEEGLVVAGGLGKGVGRAAFDGALSAEGGQAVALLPMGTHAYNTPQEVTAAVERGQALLLSPFHPEAKFDEAQAMARNKLIVGLAEAVFVVAADEAGPAREAADEALRLGKAVYVWDLDPSIEPAAAGNRALIQAGALPIAGVSDVLEAVEAVVATTLDLAEAAEPPSTPSPPAAQAEEPETPFDPQAALALLSKAGQVPEALARRLRESGRERR
jgi:predicted Rossmann fold nucleotide-binding protein DprA/Smf involved in DNA uptake